MKAREMYSLASDERDATQRVRIRTRRTMQNTMSSKSEQLVRLTNLLDEAGKGFVWASLYVEVTSVEKLGNQI